MREVHVIHLIPLYSTHAIVSLRESKIETIWIKEVKNLKYFRRLVNQQISMK